MASKPYHILVVVDSTAFALNGKSVSYRFHVDDSTGDLLSDHFGGSVTGAIPTDPTPIVNGWIGMSGRIRREFPDQGRGDFRSPAIRIRQSHIISALQYDSHTVVKGKPALPGLPFTFGDECDVTTIVIHLFDKYSAVAADLMYSVFPKYDAIVRSVSVTNKGTGSIVIEDLASLSVDFPFEDFDMIYLSGEWARETHRRRRRIDYGIQGFRSSSGFSSHSHNPFLALTHPSTTESQGEAWGFSLIYTGSFAVNVEKCPQGLTRVQLGLDSHQLSWTLGPNETLTSPECVSVYSKDGLGGISRSLHGLYRNHLIRSKFGTDNRPVLLNSWEALYFNINSHDVYRIAEESASLGVKLFVLDDGWFGKEYPRINDTAGLGDWIPNPARFPNGLAPLVKDITALESVQSSTNLRFGIWIEPEMVNTKSSLYHDHPEWALHADPYPRTEQRNQLILNLALPEVQDFIIKSVSGILRSANITYVKWDHNRCMHETPSPTIHHAYMLGLYRVFETLTTRFPDVLWEGCASGGGRFDPGIMQYFPQIWTSDNTDAVARIFIQFGTSLAYPASSMCGHISAVPNHQTGRTVPLAFRAHVAMMCGSFGLELDPGEIPPEEKAAIPDLIVLAEKVNPIVLAGDMWRLSLPEESNCPAVLFILGNQAVLFLYQLDLKVNHALPRVKLQGLGPQDLYFVDGEGPYSGAMLMSLGLQYSFGADYGSKVVFLEKVFSGLLNLGG
ncbi:hypothetical protein Asppvi_001995 [Aspergillus pseudoviridinutans]|uniref:Alpha-galactosidase n=1 Tax=Aspergillus pseudoviridinutans TaxID=1517512 RepID=A0A9P3BJY3_9EURO|nr:uncharacterized protein Asppvi_001995 [Aspergillus pseudoviridinutans]GIJ92717.1 hypothetical protein Asppvi_001995 [Aspergillus pseudoviridinutans]